MPFLIRPVFLNSQRFCASARAPLPALATPVNLELIKSALEKKYADWPQSVKKLCTECFQSNISAFMQAYFCTCFDPKLFEVLCRLEKQKNKPVQKTEKTKKTPPTSRFEKRSQGWIEFERINWIEDVAPEPKQSKYYGNFDTKNPALFPISDNPYLIPELLEEIKQHSELYKKGTPTVPNFVYDIQRQLVEHQLRHIPPEISEELGPIAARSLRKQDYTASYFEEDVQNFFKQVEKRIGKNQSRQFVFSPVINGLPFTIKYVAGHLQSASVNGDLDITDSVRHLPGVPEIISEKEDLVLSGTLYLESKDFQIINANRTVAGKTAWIDPCSAINFALNSQDAIKLLEGKLKVSFDIDNHASKLTLNTQRGIQRHDFPSVVNAYSKTGTTSAFNIYRESLLQFPFPCLGIKLVVRDSTEKNLMEKGNYSNHIYKIKPRIYETKVESILFKVQSSGVISTSLNVVPLTVAGHVVSSFPVANEADFRRLDVREKDSILVYHYPGLEPQVFQSLQDGEKESKTFPKNCPQCATGLQSQTVEGKKVDFCAAHLVCTNDNIEDIIHFVSGSGLNIPSLTEKTIKELVEKSIISTVFDIFQLTPGDWALVESVSYEEFKKIIDEIKIAKNTTFARFLYALNIPGVSYPLAEEIARLYGSINKLKQATVKELLKSNNVNKEIAREIVNFFSESTNVAKIERLLERVNITDIRKELLDLCFKDNHTREDGLKILSIIEDSNENPHKLTDLEYDTLLETAKQIQANHPDLPLKAQPKTKERTVVQWVDPLSLKKTYNIEDLKSFFEEHPDGVFVEPKVNGIACSLEYTNGELVHAYTKSIDGVKAFDIKDFIRDAKKIPQFLEMNFSGVVRGELFLSKEILSKINTDRINIGLDPYTDSLSALGPLTKLRSRSHPHVFDGVLFYGYHIANATDLPVNIQTRLDLWNFLNKIKLIGKIPSPKAFYNSASLVSHVSNSEARRYEYPVDIDGLVVKSFYFEQSDQNQTEKYTPGCLGYKFKLETLMTTLKSISFSTSKNGLVTAALDLDPIRAHNGRLISRLHVKNLGLIKNVHEGDQVYLNYGGGIPPRWQSVNEEKRSKKAKLICLPTECPTCDKKLKLIEETGSLKCTNEMCSVDQADQQLLKFTSQMGMGKPASMKKLINTGIVKKFSDFYHLIPEDFNGNELFTPTEKIRTLSAIEESKNVSLEQFLNSLSIPKLGSIYIENIASRLPTLEKVLELRQEDFVNFPGDKRGLRYLLNYVNRNRSELNKLLEMGVTQHKPNEEKSDFLSVVADTNPTEIYRSFKANEDAVVVVTKETLKNIESIDQTNREFLRSLSTMKPGPRKLRLERLLRTSEERNKKFLVEPLQKFLKRLTKK